MAEQFLVLKKAPGDSGKSGPTVLGGHTLVFLEGVPVKIDGEYPVVVDNELVSVPMSFAKAQVENNAEPWQGPGHAEYEIISASEPPPTPRRGKAGEA